jgi:hypothetical protein
MKIGDPLAVVARLDGGSSVVGRVSKIDGGKVEIMTPHGSKIESGLVYTRSCDAETLRWCEALERDPYPRRPDLKAAMLEREACCD